MKWQNECLNDQTEALNIPVPRSERDKTGDNQKQR